MGGTTDAQGHEQKRLAALRACSILDTAEDSAFDRITAMAARLFSAPVAVISFVDEKRVWFKSHFGLDLDEIPRAGSFCSRAIESGDITVLSDAAASIGGLRVRFYAGAPLISTEGYRIGTVAVMDTRSRPGLSPEEKATLADLAALVTRD